MDAEQLFLQAGAGDGIEGAERLIHEHGGGLGGERAGETDALLLPAGELGRVAIAVLVRWKADEVQQVIDTLHSALLVPFEKGGHNRDVVLDPHVGEEASLLNDIPDSPAQSRRGE